MRALVTEPIDLGLLVQAVRTDACGAIVTFLGVVRETSADDDDRPVVGIRYEAYPALAEKQLEAVAAQTAQRFGPLEIAIVHRTGELRLGDASVAIAVAAPHRGAAFDACEFAIDEIKRQAAVWKQELFADGATAWRANTAL